MTSAPPILTGRDMLARASAEPQGWLLDRVIALSGTTMVVGQACDGKTRWLANLSVAVAAGVRQAGRAVKQGAVLWLYLEHPWSDITGYLAASAKGYGLSGWLDLPIYSYDRDAAAGLNLYDRAAMVRLAEWCDEHAVGLVILDSARAVGDHEENDPAAVRRLLQHADLLSSRKTRPIVVIHHPTKAGGGSRGSGDWRGGSESEIEFKIAPEDPSTITIATKPHGAGGREEWRLFAIHDKDGTREGFLTYEEQPAKEEPRKRTRTASTERSKAGWSDLELRVMEEIRRDPDASTNQIRDRLRSRRTETYAAVKRVQDSGVLRAG